MEEFIFSRLEDACGALARDMAGHLARAVTARRRASLVLSGGRTPRTLFPLLAAADLDWAAIDITLTDERWVAPDHADSNEGLVREYLLDGLSPSPHFTGLKTKAKDPGDGVAEVEARLSSLLDGLARPFDLVLLGMGPDGHIASLFPGEPCWPHAAGLAVAVPETPGRQARMSLTPRALLASRLICLLLSGAEKKRTLDAARQPGPAAELPVRLVLHQDDVPVRIYISPC